MKPFTYEAPTSVEAAVELLAEKGELARPLAGGTDLLVQLRAGRYEVDMLVDVKRIPELTRIAYDPDEGLTFGAAVTCAVLKEHPKILLHYPGLIDAASIIGGTAIQGRATLGGNLCNASPSADAVPALIVLGAEAVVAGPEGRRRVPVGAFCTGPGATVLQQGELVVAFHLPAPQIRTGAHYLRFIPRGEMDIAVAGAGAWVVLSDDGATLTDARVALAAVAPTPLLLADAGAALAGKAPDEDAFEEAAALAREAVQPIEDTRGTIAQRRHLAGVLTKRALRGAVKRAQARVEEEA
jgi:carbon-monoxide dehydrogenase medium subunit